MRKSLSLRGRGFMATLLLVLGFVVNGYSQGHVTMSLANCSATGNSMSFDIMVVNDGTLPLHFNSTTCRITHSAAIVPTAGGPFTYSLSYDAGSSDFAAAAATYSTTYNPGTRLMQLTSSPAAVPAPVPAVELPIGTPKKIARLTLTITNGQFNAGVVTGTTWSGTTSGIVVYVNNAATTTAYNTPTTRTLGTVCSASIPVPCVPATFTHTSTPQSCANVNDGSIDISITGGNPVTEYLWSNGATTEDISGLAAGDYTVTITSGPGCTASGVIAVGAGATPVQYFADLDSDTYGGTLSLGSFCSPPSQSSLSSNDCNDNNAAINPAAQEVCDGGVDNDCDGAADDADPSVIGTTAWYADLDGDTYGAGAPHMACAASAAFPVSNNTDCDDNAATVNPGATEVCNGIDDDCANGADDGLTFVQYFADLDGDTYGGASLGSFCAPPSGLHSTVGGDCNDGDATVNPGVAVDGCNGVDNDCDGSTDEDATFSLYYVDADGDTYGAGAGTSSCSPIAGSVTNNLDCNDGSSSIHPGATEQCNGIDDDCDLAIDNGVVFVDYYRDQDGDGYGNPLVTQNACSQPVGFVSNDDDCDDALSTVNPGASEVCNTIDDDCDGSIDEGVQSSFYADGDSDGYGAGAPVMACTAPLGHVAVDGDCNDGNSAINPGAQEVCDGGIDNDCDGAADDLDASVTGTLAWYADGDGDTYGAGVATMACVAPMGMVSTNTDCDDLNAAINPAAVEVCNDIDEDCDGVADDGLPTFTYYADADGDTYGNPAAPVLDCQATAPAGTVTDNTDCNDASAISYPGATEICGDLIDNNCDGVADEGCSCTNPALVNAGVDQSVCEGDLVNLTGAFAGSATSAVWSTSGTGTFGDVNSPLTSYTPSAADNTAGTVTLTLTTNDPDGVGPCTAEASSIVITINPLPAAPGAISGPAALCYPQTPVTYSIASVAGATGYLWTVPVGTTILSGQGTTAITVSWPFSAMHAGVKGPITVTPTNSNSCGSSTGSSLSISVQVSIPVPPNSISGPGKSCPGDVATYSVAPVARADYYIWTMPTGATVVGAADGNIVSVSFDASFTGGTMSVQAGNACGIGNVRSRTVGINLLSAPASISGQTTGLCGATNVMFTAAPVTGAFSYTWTVPVGATIVGSSSGSSILVDFSGSFSTGSVTAAAINNCGTGATRSVTVKGAPATPNAISGATTVCPNGIYTYDVPTISGASSYVWTVPTGASIVAGLGTKTIDVQFGGFLASGLAISVRATNACGASSTRTLSGISVVACPRLGDGASMALTAFPNPVSEVLNITFSSDVVANANLRLVDLTGRVVYNEAKEVVEGFNTATVRVKGLASGIYTLQMQMEDRTEQIRIFVE